MADAGRGRLSRIKRGVLLKLRSAEEMVTGRLIALGAKLSLSENLTPNAKSFHHPSITFFHFARTFSFNSGLDSATGGKSFIHSKGRQASMTARELKPFFPG